MPHTDLAICHPITSDRRRDLHFSPSPGRIALIQVGSGDAWIQAGVIHVPLRAGDRIAFDESLQLSGDAQLRPIAASRHLFPWLSEHATEDTDIPQPSAAWVGRQLVCCPGRTYAHRVNALTRLLRVRILLLRATGPRVGLGHLSAVSHYSSCHLQRTYLAVFGESPQRTQARARVDAALRLLPDGRLSLNDISDLVGFESRTTFARTFRSVLGQSAQQRRDLLKRQAMPC